MEMLENTVKYTSEEGTTVLIVNIAYPTGISSAADAFYKELAQVFAESVQERFLPRAADAYNTCLDQRKRYRYSPWCAAFRAAMMNDGCNKVIELSVNIGGEVKLFERHIWDGDILKKRKNLSKSSKAMTAC